jgi:CRISPR-associated endonuclease/helicase Cas3
MDDKKLLKLWGKTKDKSDPNPKEYHPLLYHLIDVGVAAEALWPLLPRSVRERLTLALGVSKDEALRVVVLLVALHDLGKASGFQAKVPGLWQSLEDAGLTIARVDASAHHAFVTAAQGVLPKLLIETNACGIIVKSQPLANALAKAVGAHHGTFPTADTFSSAVLGGKIWDEVREALARRLKLALFPDALPVVLSQADLDDPAAGVLLTGLVAVADWIGSNQEFFVLCQEPDIDAYAARARKIAREALTILGWSNPLSFPAPRTFAAVPFEKGKSFTPQGIQKHVETLVSGATSPYLMICEAAMGEGKTEAALFAIDRALTSGQALGFYLALPTQATGSAMFSRVETYLGGDPEALRRNFQLVHGGAEFHEGFQKLRMAANGKGQDDPPVVAESWFTNKKQALLAPFGTGTIDQGLIGVLQTKHWFVRLFGLAGKVVVFDEVHAYDAYMNALLCRLIRWLSALDCTVILLSATLPAKTRHALIEEYAPGAALPEAAYPRVSFAPKVGAATSVSAFDPSVAQKTVALTFAAPDYVALAAQILRDLPSGGCTVLICNTVRNAQAAYDAFTEALAKEGWEIELFHARTLLTWRQEREKSVLDKLGKVGRAKKRPPKYVLIGTQVLEQSLDYDADWMASEFAPGDLLLQRMGRLWRHKRDNRPTKERCFTVLVETPASNEELPQFPEGSDLIYAKYILLRTFLALHGRSEISLPSKIEPLVKSVYDDDAPEGLSEEWTEKLKATWNDLIRDEGDERGEAEANLIPD